MFETFHFIRPWWFLLLIPSAVLLWLIWRRQDTLRGWKKIMDPQLLRALVQGETQKQTIRPVTLLAAILILGIIALAGPTWSFEPSPFAEDQAALVIVLKVNTSMEEQDVQPSRLKRAVQKIQDLLKLRSGARTALIAYSGTAHLVMPLTKDAGIINTFAADLSPKIMPIDGNAAKGAYALAEKELTRAHASGSIVWITDSLPNSIKFTDTPVQVLGMVGPDVLDGLKSSASASGASFTQVSIDDSDITHLNQGIDTSFKAQPSDEGAHWRDQGYWLLPLISILALFWFRPGWSVS